MASEIKIVLSADADSAQRGIDKVDASLGKLNTSSRAAAAQARNLQFQLTDIVVGLSTGQQPLTVLLQQGGQLKDAYGGVVPALGAVTRGVLAMINPVTLAAAAVGGFTLVAMQGYNEQQAFRSSLVLTGNAAGATAGSYEASALRIADSTRITVGSAKELVQGAISNGAFGPAAVNAITMAAARIQSVTGHTSEEVLKAFVGMSGGVANWAAQANTAYNFLDVAQWKHIRTLEEQGKSQEAMTLTADALSEALGQRMPTQLGSLDKALDWTAKKWSEFWAAAKGIGKDKTLEEQLAEARNALDVFGTPGAPGSLTERSRAGKRAAAAEQVRSLEIALQLQREAAAADAANASRNAAAINAASKTPAKAPRPTNAEGDLGGKRLSAFIDDQLNAQRGRDSAAWEKFEQDIERRNEQAAEFAVGLRDQTSALNNSLISDDRARGLAQIDLERRVMQSRISILAEGGADVTKAQAELNANILARQAQLTEELKPEWQRLVDQWRDVTSQMSRLSQNFTDGFVSAGRDAFQDFLTTANFSLDAFKGLVIRTITQLVYDRYIAQQMANLGDTLINSLSNFITGGGSLSGGNAPTGGSGLKLNPAHFANGGMFGGGVRLVGERGPELEVTGPSRIFSAEQTRRMLSGRGGVVINQIINVGQGASYAEVFAAARTAKDSAIAEIRQQVDRGDRFWDR